MTSHSTAKPTGWTAYAARRSGWDSESSYASCAPAVMGAARNPIARPRTKRRRFTPHLPRPPRPGPAWKDRLAAPPPRLKKARRGFVDTANLASLESRALQPESDDGDRKSVV